VAPRPINMHGLRKNAASEVAAPLFGSAGIKSVTGPKSDQMAEYYAKHANQIPSTGRSLSGGMRLWRPRVTSAQRSGRRRFGG
jgi:hypothetical protein